MDIEKSMKVAGYIYFDNYESTIFYQMDEEDTAENYFVFQEQMGAYSKIFIDAPTKIEIPDVTSDMCKDVLDAVTIKFEEQGMTLHGIIFAKDGIYALMTVEEDEYDIQEAYCIQLPDCIIDLNDKYDVSISDIEI